MPVVELVAPAGSLEKLRYAYLYGADAAYIGVSAFSLRSRSESLLEESPGDIVAIKGRKRLYGALNMYFRDADLRGLESDLETIASLPFDGLIVSDLGALSVIRRHFGDVPLHLSTQANCLNGDAARMYQDLGFSRIILGRELALSEIAAIRRAVPDLQLEVFVHGAMCIAYSGRCYLSSYMAGRSGNQGDCAHACRWEYRVLEERERPGEYYPVEGNDGFSTILSSRDLCMIDHIDELVDAGVDALKIEGRMKSVYHAAIVTRAYRKTIDAVGGPEGPELSEYREEVNKVSHRQFTTGFYFGDKEEQLPTRGPYVQPYQFLGILGEHIADGIYELDIRNRIKKGDTIEFVGPDVVSLSDSDFKLYVHSGDELEEVSQADHPKRHAIRPRQGAKPGYLIRKRLST